MRNDGCVECVELCEEVESKGPRCFRCLILPVELLFLLFLIASWTSDLVRLYISGVKFAYVSVDYSVCAYGSVICYFGCFGCGGEFGFLYCYDIWLCCVCELSKLLLFVCNVVDVYL